MIKRTKYFSDELKKEIELNECCRLKRLSGMCFRENNCEKCKENFLERNRIMLIRTAVLRVRENQPDEILIPAQEILAENQAEAKLRILMNHAMDEVKIREGNIILKDIPKKELVVVCSDFTRVK